MSNINELNLEEMEAISGGAFKPLPKKEGFLVYQIQKNDTLSRIAKANNTTVVRLMKENPKIVDINKLYAGDFIYIPVR